MIICIEGPTAAGKSACAIQLALALDTEIISADSRQVFRHLDIGTAKVSKEEQAQVKHHLIDIIEPEESYNAGRFVKDASGIIQGLQDAGKIPIICGGTGLYIRSLLEGLFEHPIIPTSIRERLKEELRERGLAALYQELQELDPDFATRISNSDSQRILRGLEIYRVTGKNISAHWAEQSKTSRYQALRILITRERAELYSAINQRINTMLSQGWMAEIEGLLAQGYAWDTPGLKTMGYKEFRPYYEGRDSLENCAALAAQHHRNYAKRQFTWYRKINFNLTYSPKCFKLSEILRFL
ncbi:MAG: tRNA (adenosine(37)-N6)-dimethylallyltransferase MiaA [Candidatus Cloacimonadaceae bacterium]